VVEFSVVPQLSPHDAEGTGTHALGGGLTIREGGLVVRGGFGVNRGLVLMKSTLGRSYFVPDSSNERRDTISQVIIALTVKTRELREQILETFNSILQLLMLFAIHLDGHLT
jgi:hypothetical protein